MQVNFVTAWIDGSSIYGPSSSWSDSLRSFTGGLLASGSEWDMPNEGTGHSFMWSAPDPSTGEHGPHGLYGERVSLCTSMCICESKFPIECESLVCVPLSANEVQSNMVYPTSPNVTPSGIKK